MSKVHVEAGDHVLQFYERDSDLIRTVAAHIREGLENGEIAVLIATPEHRLALRQELDGTGFDVAEAERKGSVVELDADTTLARLRCDGHLDREIFFEVVGQVVRDACSTGSAVRAYGEMVTLLWDAGDVLSVIELESLWNELQSELPFSLLCAYPSESDPGQKLSETLRNVCELHSHSLGADGSELETHDGRLQERTRQVTARFQATVDAPAAARHLLVETLTTWGYDEHLVNDGLIVISELTGNAVLHVGRPFLVTISESREYVRMSVRDPDALSSVDYEPGPLAVSGRGLWLVDAIAHRWGVNLASDHKTVWADLCASEDGE